VGESGRPRLPWKQETGGSNPPTLTIRISYVGHILLPEKNVARRGGGNTARANGIVIPENARSMSPHLVAELEHAGEHNSDIVSQKAAATRA
jgi:hypothetical protein